MVNVNYPKDMIKDSAIIILGASGDLTKRKLAPALKEIVSFGMIDISSCLIVGCARSDYSNEEFRGLFGFEEETSARVFYHRGIKELKKFIDSHGKFKKYTFFFSLPPSAYADSARSLIEEGFRKGVHLIIEKPFGYDYESACKLNSELTECYPEEDIYRIDHYLAKETVQNILVFRFANSLFEPVWNRNFIKSIEINAFETLGVEKRGDYFDRSGIIRDMVQNHLLQLICLLTMEAPVTIDAIDISNQKMNLLKNLHFKECYRYQYDTYRSEEKVAPDSRTETFVEMKAEVYSFRWHGVPIYIRTGKRAHRRGTEICVNFHGTPPILFNEDGKLSNNKIIFLIQPRSGIVINKMSKAPGQDFLLAETNLNFCFNTAFGDIMPEAYRKLIIDTLNGDKTLFVEARFTELAWKKVDPFLGRGELFSYRSGNLPHSRLKESWTEMERYINLC